jgi:hypothetical protein
MYFKTLLAMGCVMFSAPAFAQSSDFARHSQLPPCPEGVTRQREPCRYLEWNRKQPNLNPRSQVERQQQQRGNDNRTTAERYGWGRNPQEAPSPYGQLPERFERSHPTYKDRAFGWQWGRGSSEPESHR